MGEREVSQRTCQMLTLLFLVVAMGINAYSLSLSYSALCRAEAVLQAKERTPNPPPRYIQIKTHPVKRRTVL